MNTVPIDNSLPGRSTNKARSVTRAGFVVFKESNSRSTASTGMVLVAVNAAKAINPMFIPVESAEAKTGFFGGTVLMPDSGAIEIIAVVEVLECTTNETANIRTGKGVVFVRFRTADAKVTVDDDGSEITLASEAPEGISAKTADPEVVPGKPPYEKVAEYNEAHRIGKHI